MAGLTRRERQVMDRWDAGESDIASIANDIGISERNAASIIHRLNVSPGAEERAERLRMERCSRELLNALRQGGFA